MRGPIPIYNTKKQQKESSDAINHIIYTVHEILLI